MFHHILQRERILDVGEIRSICLPPRWLEVPVLSFGRKAVRKFTPINFCDVRICSVIDAALLNPKSVSSFRRILSMKFHDLSVEEIEELGDLLEAIADKEFFEIELMRTGNLNHRRILKVSGTWQKTNERMIGGLIDTDKNGSVMQIQQVHFVAPAFNYDVFEADALESLMSIIWKS